MASGKSTSLLYDVAECTNTVESGINYGLEPEEYSVTSIGSMPQRVVGFTIGKEEIKICHEVRVGCESETVVSSKLERAGTDCDSSADSPMTDSDCSSSGGSPAWPPWAHYIKLAILLVCWTLCSAALICRSEHVTFMHQVSVPPAKHSRGHFIGEHPVKKQMTVILEGALLPSYYGNLSRHWMSVWIELVALNYIPPNISDVVESFDVDAVQNISQEWRVPIVSHDLIGFVPEVKQRRIFELTHTHIPQSASEFRLRLKFRTNLRAAVFPISFAYNLSPIDVEEGVIYAAILLLGLYVLIIFEIVHRTLAAMLASTMALAILAALNERPSMKEIISWIDVETLLLLFSMMILVAIFSETGVFDYMAVLAYKVTNGQMWPLINTLCFFTALLSSFLDNVTTVLLMTPVTIRLCEVMELNPVPILMIMVIYSNIGGALTPVGDPPNVIIASNSAIIRSGVNFTTFFLHMGIGVVISALVVYLQLRFKFRDVRDLQFKEPQDVQHLRHELAIWEKTAASMSSYSKDEDNVKESLLKKTRRLLNQLKARMTQKTVAGAKYKATLEELQEKYPIRDMALLVKSGCTLLIVVFVFFLHSVPEFSRLGLGWTALLGVMLLLLLADRDDIETVLARVEWSTLLFFASLFILMEALSQLGLIDWIGQQTQSVILSVDKQSRLAVAILLILWVSAAASAFVDNIPLTTMMVRIATVISEDRDLGLPLQPLVWALSFGACLGGNGTLFGASANVICAGVAEQHGYKFTFIDFFKLGFPIMLTSMVVITAYMLVAHVVIGWNY